jgi:hypothetical protein
MYYNIYIIYICINVYFVCKNESPLAADMSAVIAIATSRIDWQIMNIFLSYFCLQF